MENKKGNKKQKIVLILLLLVVLCCGGVAGVTLFNQRQNDQVATEEPDKKDETTEVGKVSSNRYTVIVKSDTGVVLPNVLVSIYDTEGNMLTVPEATDTAGRLIYTAEQKGTYGARVMAAPFQYALDTEVYYFETGTNVLSIVLKEDPAAYVARIGETYYTLRGAISAANASTTDVTITLLHDVHVVGVLGINNKNGKTITVDGCGKSVTYLSNSTLFSISQKEGTVHFKNMKVVHNGAGAVFRTSNAINLNMTDMTILAQNDTEGFYKWSLINLFGVGKTNLTMTRVKIDMDITTIEKDASSAAVIRTGNEGNAKDITITMNDCYIDATGAMGRAGIRVTVDTSANVVFNNTTFLTQNNYVIAVDDRLTWSQTNSTLGSLDEYYNEHPVPDVIATFAGVNYYSLSAAVKKASQLGGKEPVKLIGDVSVGTTTTFTGDGITAIIDGNGHTLTTERGNTIFKINGNNYKLTFRNMTINHGSYERLLQYEANKENIDVTWENVKVVASGTSEDACYKFGLMNLRGSGSFTMKSSSITLNVPKIINGSAPGVIRTGNANDGQELTICLDNSRIDASATTGAYGIYVQKGVTADIVLKKYEIHTKNTYPVYVHADDGDATLTYDDMNTWSCESTNINWLCNLLSMLNLKDAAKIGDTAYETLPEALDAARKAGGEVTITLLRDCILSEKMMFETADSSIIIDGDEKYSLATKGSALIFVLDNDNVALKFKDLAIHHKGYERFVTFNKKSDGVYAGMNVTFENVKMDASGTSDNNCYQWGLFNLRASGTFTMINSTITLDVEEVKGITSDNLVNDLTTCGVIRLGNPNDGQTVQITMNNSSIDASKTKHIAGINVSNGATAEVAILSSTIKTNNKHAINVNSTGALTLAQTNSDWSCADATVKSITNCATKIGNNYYGNFAKAWNAALELGGATTITLLRDCELSERLIVETAGSSITIDGEGEHSLTTKGSALIFVLDNDNVALKFKDLAIHHKGYERFVTFNKKSDGVYTGMNVTFENVRMDASGTSDNNCYQWGLFNLRASGAFTMINSTITLDVEEVKGITSDNLVNDLTTCGVIRLGNPNDGQTVQITMNNSSIDASKTKHIAGINVSNGATAEVAILSSTIKTNNKHAINVNSTGALTLAQTNSDWSCVDATIKSITNCVAKIGNDYYGSFAEAWDTALKLGGATTITLTNDCTLESRLSDIKVAGIKITIDGQDKYTLTTKIDNKTDNVIRMDSLGKGAKVNLKFQNMKINHQSPRSLVAVQSNCKDASVQVTVDNVDVDVRYSNNNYYLMYGLFNLRGNATIFMTDVTTTVACTGKTNYEAASIIRVGNAGDNITAYARLQNCTLDTTAGQNVFIATVNDGNTLNISCRESTLKTKNTYVFNKTTSGTLKASVDTYTNEHSVAGGKTQLYSDGTTYETVNNLNKASAGASINGFLYTDLKKAFDDAQLVNGYVTIKMLKDSSWATSANVEMSTSYVDITIDGLKSDGQGNYKLTSGTKNAGRTAFYIKSDNVSLTVQNVDIHYVSTRAIVRLDVIKDTDQNIVPYKDVNVSFENVNITTEKFDGTTTHQYGLFNIQGNADFYMKDVTIDYHNSAAKIDTSTNAKDYAVFRFGTSGETKTVNVELEDCTVKMNETVAPVFGVPNNSTVNIKAKGCTFETYKATLVYRDASNNMTLNWWNTSTWSDTTGTYKSWVNTTDCREGYSCIKIEK